MLAMGGSFGCGVVVRGGARSCSSAGGGRLASSGEVDPAARGDELTRMPRFAVFVESRQLSDGRCWFSALPAQVVQPGLQSLQDSKSSNSREVDGRGWGEVVDGD